METRSVGSSRCRSPASGATTSGCASTKRRRRPSSTPRSTPASTTSTPPTSTAAGSRRSSSAGRSGSRRDDAIITTKVGMRRARGRAPAASESASSRALRREPRPARHRLHRPLPAAPCPTPTTPIGETLAAFAKLVAAGKVREIGCSNFSGAQLEEAEAAAKELGVPRFVNVQNDYSLLDRARRGRGDPRVRAARRRCSCPTSRSRAACSPASTSGARRTPRASRLAAWGDRWPTSSLSDEKLDVVERLDEYAQRPRAHAARARAVVARRRADGRRA